MRVTKLLLIILVLLVSQDVLGQSRTALEKKRKKLLQKIELTNKLLVKTKKNKAASLNELETLQMQIVNRRELIRNINSQIKIYQRQIDETYQIINALEEDLSNLKQEYAKMIYYTYKNQGAYNKVLFIFSSTSFNEAYKRSQYLKRYTQQRQEQADLIHRTKEQLNVKVASLEKSQASKKRLLSNMLDQKKELDKEKDEKNELVTKLKKEERKLRAMIDRDRKAAQKLNKKIEEIIRKEIAAANKGKSGSKMKLTPEAARLSESFATNKGKLPWPVERGVVTKTFGEHKHPVLTGVKIQNNGIDIKTSSNSTIRSVFEGEVAEVFSNPTFHNAVMIRHGEYFTVYTNLKEVYVKKGDKVTTKQTIGIVHTGENNNSQVHFEIWKGFTKMNPSYWIFKN